MNFKRIFGFRIPMLFRSRPLVFFSSLSYRKAIPVYSRYLSDNQSQIQFSIFKDDEMFKIIGKNNQTLKDLLQKFQKNLPGVKSLYATQHESKLSKTK